MEDWNIRMMEDWDEWKKVAGYELQVMGFCGDMAIITNSFWLGKPVLVPHPDAHGRYQLEITIQMDKSGFLIGC